MLNKTVEKTSNARPSESGKPTKQTNALIGGITKGSSGRLKGYSKGADAGTTRANQTTSTSTPKSVPKSFLNKLGEMHRSESELSLALPLVVVAAKSKDLKALLNLHLKETKGHVKALNNIAKSLGVELPSKSCKEMTKLIGEAVKVIGKRIVTSDQDQELIAVGQKIEQFEISSYEPLCAEAKEHEYTHENALLTSILNQEKLASELLGELAAGKGPLNKLVEKVSLQKAGAKS